MKDCLKNANIGFSKDKTSIYQSSSKLVNDDTMEKSALITRKINIQLDDVREESRRRFYESKEKNGKKTSRVNETSRDVLNEMLSLKNFLKNCVQHARL